MPGYPGAGGCMMGQPVNESLQISVPNSAVGAIIGAGGANIKQIMRESGAFVNVSIMPIIVLLHSSSLAFACLSIVLLLGVCFSCLSTILRR